MKKHIKFYIALVAVAIVCGAWLSIELNSNIPPNVLVVIIDDLGYHDLSSTGSKIYQTPNVDKIARESYSFRNAYANYPRCLPSRFALITATYPIKEFDGILSTVSFDNNFIKQFKKAGFKSYYVGKWHQRGEANSPKGFGFDYSFAANSAGGVASHFFPYNTQKITAPIGEVEPVRDVESEGKVGDYLADVLTEKMMTFIKNHDKSKPFFGILSTYAVHSPFEAKQEDIDRNVRQISNFNFNDTPEYVTEGNGVTKMRQNNAEYAAMVENMDWNVGRLLKTLKESGLDKNTIVVFTSDHGGLSNRGPGDRKLATTNFPLRAGKGHLYEGGTRVPLLVRWPGKIKPKEDNKSIVVLMDLMPSLLDLAVDGQMKNVDGKSFKKVLDGKEEWSERTVFFYEKMARPTMTGDFPCLAVRSGKYKLLNYLENNKFELYDLATDPSEKNNLVETLPDVVKRLKDEMAVWKANHINNENN